MSFEEETIQEMVSLRTGIEKGDVPILTKTEDQIRPNAVRWFFNPFEVIDLTDASASFSQPFIKNIVFNKIESIPTRVKAYRPFDIGGATGPGGQNAEYMTIDRTAYQQTGDIQDWHSEKGVIAVDALTGADERTAAAMNIALFGDEIQCVRDVNYENFPCPVLPDVLETMEANLAGVSDSTTLAAASQIRSAVRTAIKNARSRINEAQRRILDEKNPNRMLSPAEQRCYLALGEEIPDQMPYLTKSAAGRGNDFSGLGDQIATGMAKALAMAAPVATKPNTPVIIPTAGPQMGDDVSVNGRDGVVVGRPGGRYTVDFDGEKQTFSKDEVKLKDN